MPVFRTYSIIHCIFPHVSSLKYHSNPISFIPALTTLDHSYHQFPQRWHFVIPFDMTMVNILHPCQILLTKVKWLPLFLGKIRPNLYNWSLQLLFFFPQLLCKTLHSKIARTIFPMLPDDLTIQCLFLSSSDVICVSSHWIWPDLGTQS